MTSTLLRRYPRSRPKFIDRPSSAPYPRHTFSPADLPGLVLWHEDDLCSLFQDNTFAAPATAEGDPVGGYRGRLTTADDGTQATAGNKPRLHVASSPWTGKRVINCQDNARHMAVAGVAAGSTTKSYIAVAYITSLAANNVLFGTSVSGQGAVFRINTDGTLNGALDSTTGTPSTGVVVVNTKYLIGMSHNGGNLVYYLGTSAAAFAQDSTGTVGDTSPLAANRRLYNAAAGTVGLVGYAPLMLEGNAVWTAADFANIAQYARWNRWIS